MNNREHIRDLAKRYMELSSSPQQIQKSKLWRAHNSLERVRPLYFIRKIPYEEFFDFSSIRYTEEPLRSIEIMLATSVEYRCRLQDDFIFKPWVTVDAVLTHPIENRWGVPCSLGEKKQEGGAASFKPQIFGEEDLYKLKISPYEIDGERTGERAEKVYDILGDVIGIYVNKRGLYAREWNMDISTDLAMLIGLENFMWYVYDKPEFLHKLLAFMRDAILADFAAIEKSGGNCLADNTNQSIPFAEELPDPDCNVTGCPTKDLWGFFASQETTMVGPKFFDEFMLRYQAPVMELFGLTAYGCCEDLTQKIELLKKIKNLRRIAVTPFASDVEKCAEQIGGDYVLSWRPSPSSMISQGLDEDYVRRHMRENFAHFRRHNCIFDVTLKDVETINHSPANLIRWSEIVREEIESY